MSLTFRELAALWACKLSHKLLRLLRRGGTSFPGKVAVKLCPGLLGKLAVGVETVAVSGTNGKTTTCRMVEAGLQRAGAPYFCNRSGANLTAGVTAEFCRNADWRGRPRARRAVIECDELAAARVFALMQPKVIVLTNLFRDQLDRCGEVTRTLRALTAAAEAAPNAVLCVNADDPLLCTLAAETPHTAAYYGVAGPLFATAVRENSDAAYCTRCGAPYAYGYVTYGHLGQWHCPACGAARPPARVEARLLEGGDGGSRIELRIGGETRPVFVPIPAACNVYNAAAAACALDALGLAAEDIAAAMEHCRRGFGRMEEFDLGCPVQMMLVKNPAGCNQALRYLDGRQGPYTLALCLNDRLADGTDVSWIWDADFEHLWEGGSAPARVLLAGDRRRELLVRLKYAGADPAALTLCDSYEALAADIRSAALPTVIVPTYTAMMALRPVLAKQTGAADFWE